MLFYTLYKLEIPIQNLNSSLQTTPWPLLKYQGLQLPNLQHYPPLPHEQIIQPKPCISLLMNSIVVQKWYFSPKINLLVQNYLPLVWLCVSLFVELHLLLSEWIEVLPKVPLGCKNMKRFQSLHLITPFISRRREDRVLVSNAATRSRLEAWETNSYSPQITPFIPRMSQIFILPELGTVSASLAVYQWLMKLIF